MRHQKAFTLIELVLIILLIGVLAISVFPKLFGQSEVNAFAVRDQLIGQLRLVQLQALNHRDVCHNLIITPTKFGIIPNTSEACGATIDDGIDVNDARITIGSSTTLDIRFDDDGRPATINGAGDCVGGCEIIITGADTVSIIIESEGYIHGS